MPAERITLHRTNVDKTEVIEQYPKTITSQVYDFDNDKFLNETLNEVSQQLVQTDERVGRRYNLSEFGDCYGEGKYADEAFIAVRMFFEGAEKGCVVITENIKTRNTVLLDLKNVSYEFIPNVIWDASEVPLDNYAVHIDKALYWNHIVNMNLQGNEDRRSYGILFENDDNTDNVSNCVIKNCEITRFKTGVVIGRNAYILRFLDTGIFLCTTCVHQIPGKNNYGENISFVDCVLGGGYTGILQENPEGTFNLVNTSIDFVTVFIDARNGRVDCSNCHFETDSRGDGTAYYYTRSDNSVIHFFGGQQVINGTFTRNNMDYIFYTSQSSHGGIYIDGLFSYILNAKSNFLCGGTGLLYINSIGRSRFESGTVFKSIHHNKLADPTFANTTNLDFYISRGNTTSRLSNSILDLINVDNKLRVNLKVNNGYNTYFSTLVDLSSDRIYGASFTVNNIVGLNSGTLFLNLRFVKIRGYDSNGLPIIVRSENRINGSGFDLLSSNEHTFSINGLDQFRNQQKPEWATHAMFEFSMTTSGAGSFDIAEAFVGSSN